MTNVLGIGWRSGEARSDQVTALQVAKRGEIRAGEPLGVSEVPSRCLATQPHVSRLQIVRACLLTLP